MIYSSQYALNSTFFSGRVFTSLAESRLGSTAAERTDQRTVRDDVGFHTLGQPQGTALRQVAHCTSFFFLQTDMRDALVACNILEQMTMVGDGW